MCNLYDIGPAPEQQTEFWAAEVGALIRDSLPRDLSIRKTDPGVVVRREDDTFSPSMMRWGFSRDFNPSINNARCDKLHSGMWGKAWRENRRCLIPVAAFYEWTGPKGHKECYAFRSRSGHWLWAGGLWERNSRIDDCGGLCYTMLTNEAEAPFSEIHHRMPVILHPDAIDDFLGGSEEEDILQPWGEDVEYFACQSPLRMKTPSPPVPI